MHIYAWKIPWTEEPGGLQSMGSLRVGHDWATSLSLFTFMHWRRKWQPTPVFLPGESQGRGAWWAAVSGVTESRTQVKRLSSSSSMQLLPGLLKKHWVTPLGKRRKHLVLFCIKVLRRGVQSEGRRCLWYLHAVPPWSKSSIHRSQWNHTGPGSIPENQAYP